MRLFADENVALLVIEHLRSTGHDIVRIAQNDLSSDDAMVLNLATRDQRALLTFDSDFGTLTVKGGVAAPYGIVYCRLHLLENKRAGARIADVLFEIDTIANRIVVIDEQRHRIRDLSGPST